MPKEEKRAKRPAPVKRILTTRQKTFAKYVVEGIYSNAHCARMAGYAPESAAIHASKMLNGREYPQVVAYIQELREEKERKYGVTTMGQLERLYTLSRGAEEAGQFSSAIAAEKLRSALGGLTIDRRETINTIDQLSRDQITARLAELAQKYPQAFAITDQRREMKDITPSVEDAELVPVEWEEGEEGDEWEEAADDED